jgi:hypothetical protein
MPTENTSRAGTPEAIQNASVQRIVRTSSLCPVSTLATATTVVLPEGCG